MLHTVIHCKAVGATSLYWQIVNRSHCSHCEKHPQGPFNAAANMSLALSLSDMVTQPRCTDCKTLYTQCSEWWALQVTELCWTPPWWDLLCLSSEHLHFYILPNGAHCRIALHFTLPVTSEFSFTAVSELRNQLLTPTRASHPCHRSYLSPCHCLLFSSELALFAWALYMWAYA